MAFSRLRLRKWEKVPEGRMRALGCEGKQDGVTDGGEAAVDGVIPETQDAVTLLFEI